MNHMTGAVGRYEQGPGAAGAAGEGLRRDGCGRVLVLHGRTAWKAAGEAVASGLKSAGVAYSAVPYEGFCTCEDVAAFANKAARHGFDAVLGVGGGKLMDFSKAVAEALDRPVYAVPTVASTCAACAPLSVLYTPEGRQREICHHRQPVRAVWADTGILAAAPARYLAAGIADAFAKSCEYSSMRARVEAGDLSPGLFMGYRLACAIDDALLLRAREAVLENQRGEPGAAFSEAVACVMLFVGEVSCMGGFDGRQNARFRIAHAYNEIIRGAYVPDPRRWLHGEIVAVGILAQLRANGAPAELYGRVKALFADLGVPTTLSMLGMTLSDGELASFAGHLLRHSHTEPEYDDIVRRAVYEGR